MKTIDFVASITTTLYNPIQPSIPLAWKEREGVHSSSSLQNHLGDPTRHVGERWVDKSRFALAVMLKVVKTVEAWMLGVTRQIEICES